MHLVYVVQVIYNFVWYLFGVHGCVAMTWHQLKVYLHCGCVLSEDLSHIHSGCAPEIGYHLKTIFRMRLIMFDKDMRRLVMVSDEID